MSDLISRNEALNTLCECCSDVVRCNYTCIKYDSILHVPTVDAMPKWISVKAGLPKAFKDVDIAFGNSDSIGFYSYVSGRWYLTTRDGGVPVSGVHHWKYRDEPPKEDT